MGGQMIRASGRIQDVIDRLDGLNKEFRMEVQSLGEIKNRLITNWAGAASDTFQNRFVKEEQGFENFAQAIDEYIQALQRILENYISKEAEATTIAEG